MRCRKEGSLAGLIAIAAILIIDLYFELASPSLLFLAIFDEIAHLLTAILFLTVFSGRLSGWFASGCVAGALLIDLDHIPILLSTTEFSSIEGRPLTHSLPILLLTLVIGLLVPVWYSGIQLRPLVLGAAFGIATHLFRDMGTGGVPLLWPLTEATIEIPYLAYILPLSVAATIPALRHARVERRPESAV